MSATHTVEHATDILSFLFSRYPDAKRTTVRQWLKYGSVQVNGRPITRSNHALKAGDLVSVRSKQQALAEGLLPPRLKVLFEDASLVVIDKPDGLLSVASATERHNTVYAFLTNYVRRGNSQSDERVWIVHRLDRDASGIMVFAKTQLVKRSLQSKWTEAEKYYQAVVEGKPPKDQGVLKSHLDESQPFKVYSARPSDRTRVALTDYRVMKQTPIRTLVELAPKTGRRNQIRVHLADAGCPIIGDPKYGAKTNPAGRLCLHASSLSFQHPETGELLKFRSPLPAELARLVGGKQ